jgi:hypothetical protein
MALELTILTLRYLEAVSLNPEALNAETPAVPESCFAAAVEEATAFTSRTNMTPATLAAVNASEQTVKALLTEAEATDGFKPLVPVVVTSTTPTNARALPVTLAVLGTAWQQLQVAPADRTMTLDLIRTAEVETAHAAAGVLLPPATAEGVNKAAVAVEGTPVPVPGPAPRATTTRTLSADQVAALEREWVGMEKALKAAGITVPPPAA